MKTLFWLEGKRKNIAPPYKLNDRSLTRTTFIDTVRVTISHEPILMFWTNVFKD